MVISIMKGTAESQLQEYHRVATENMNLRLVKQKQAERIGSFLTDINSLNSR
jgi:hypothetical protein